MILVTGATGFVGRHLVQEMQRRDCPVRPVSRRPLNGHVAIGEITKDTDWSSALAGVDCIIHLAARVHVMQETAQNPLQAFRDMNVDATLNLALQAATAGVRRFLFVSSIKVNGETTPEGAPFDADQPPMPQDPYGISKAEAEAELFRLGAQTGLEIVVVRPPLVYGPGVGANFRLLMRWAGSGLPSLFGACRNRRSLVHLDNLADLLICAATHPAAANQVFLASDGEDLSTDDLFRTLATLQGKTPRSLPIPTALMTTGARLLGKAALAERLLQNLQVDIGKTGAILGWTPKVSTRQGLQRTLLGRADRE